MSVLEKKLLVEPGHPDISIAEQCDILGLARSSFYYEPARESEDNLYYMRLIDESYLNHPDFGYRRMHVILKRAGHDINEKRVLRLMQLMGIQSILPKKNLSLANKEHKKYPYLLNGILIHKSMQVFVMDITYIPMQNGFIYLTAILDVYSRYIVAWEVSNTLDAIFCLDALRNALSKYGSPEIFNTDQGSQFTAEDFVNILLLNGILVSMDGKGRAIDNVFIERFWWSIKYELIYPSHWTTVPDAIQGIRNYMEYYCKERPHESLDYATPHEIFTGRLLRGFGRKHEAFYTRRR